MAEKQATIERQRLDLQFAEWTRQEAERQAREAAKASTEELLSIIEHWTEARRIETFLAEVEQALLGTESCNRMRLMERVKAARSLIGPSEALSRFAAWKTPNERANESSEG